MGEEKYTKVLSLELDENNGYIFTSSIESAINEAEREREALLFSVSENLESLKLLTPKCDKLDYALAACSGVLCGMIDVFLVGIPEDSSLIYVSDQWFEDRTKDFAKIYGWTDDGLHSGEHGKPPLKAERLLVNEDALAA